MDNKTLFFIFLIGILLVPGALAIGVTPGRTTIDFEPELEKQVSFTILNTEHKDMRIAFRVEGELSQYITVPLAVEEMAADEESKTFSYNIKLPRGLSPGLRKSNVIALEVPPEGEEGGTVVKATVSVVTQVYLNVPYPGKYVEANLDVVTKDSGDIDFIVPFISRGEEAIDAVSATIDIFKGTELIETLSSSSLPVTPGERKEFVISWSPLVQPGTYTAVAHIAFDGQVGQDISQEFVVGSSELGVLGISVNDFTLGEIAKIRILVQNQLSDSIENVFANLKIYDIDLNQIADLRSEDYTIGPSSNEELVVYWDTETVDKGEYGSELRIDYKELFLNKNFKLQVTEDSISFSGVGFVVGNEASAGTVSLTTILIGVIGLLILVNIAWFFWWMRHKKKK